MFASSGIWTEHEVFLAEHINPGQREHPLTEWPVPLHDVESSHLHGLCVQVVHRASYHIGYRLFGNAWNDRWAKT